LEAQLAEARNAEADTQIIAPLRRLHQETNVEVGQFVTIGTKLASCFAIDAVEVRLPITDEEFAFLGLPLGTSLPSGSGPAVELTPSLPVNTVPLGGQHRSQRGHGRRAKPHGLPRRPGSSPLRDFASEWRTAPGGGHVCRGDDSLCPEEDAIVLPESCVSSAGEIFVVNSDGRLELTQIQTLRREQEWIVHLRSTWRCAGWATVCTTRLESAVPGMAVQIVGEVPPVVASNVAASR
jgi:hypothetical protein